MPININSTMAGLEPYEYNFILRSPNGMMINNILGVFDIDFNPRLETVSNLKLKIAKYVTYKNEEIENPVWDYLEEPFLISLNDEITFRIDEVSFSADENNGVTKEVTALSLENEMSSKLVQNFKSTINDEANPQTIDVILNDYLAEKLNNLWKIGNTDGEVMTRLRLVPDTDEKTLYEFFKDVQIAYNCIFKYDSSIDPTTRRPKRLIHIYDNTTYKVCPNCGSDIFYQDNYQHCKNPNCAKDGVNKDVSDDYVWSKAIYGLDSGLIITDTNYIKNYNEKFEKPVTRLYVKGADDLDIILANPTGQDYIDDFSYYTGSDYDNTKFMSPELLDALKRYNVLLESLSKQIEPLREKVNQLTIKKSNLLYGNIEGIAEDLAMVEGWLDRANEYFNDWYKNNDEDTLKNANSLLDTVDAWFDGKEVTVGNVSKKRTDWYYDDGVGNTQTYGIENLQRLYNVYDERISIIGQLNDKLEYTKEDGEYLLQNIPDTTTLDTRFDGINVSNLIKIRKQINTAITDLNEILSTVETDIINTKDKLSELRGKISKQYAQDNDGFIFTEDLIKELNLFIIEGTYTNDTIGTSADIGSKEYIEACEELYKDGLIAMKEKHEPLIIVEADVIDFLSCCDCVLDAARIGIGNIIRVQHSESPSKKNNFDNMIFRVVEYSHNPMSNSLSLTLSNTEHFKSDRSSVATLLNKASSTSSVVSISKGSWNRAEQNAVDTIINDGLNTAKTTIQCADHQRSVMDNRGLTMGSYVESESNKQVRLMNTGLYITVDNWGTIKSAVTADGVIADRLIGRQLIGNTLMLDASSDDGDTVFARFDSKGFRIANGSLSVGNVDGETGDVDFDGQGFFVDPNRGVIVRNNATNPCEIRLNPNLGYRCNKCGHIQETKGACEVIVNAETNTHCNGTAEEYNKTIEVVTVNSTTGNTTSHMCFDKSKNEFVVNGDMFAKRLFLSELGENKNVVDYINENIIDDKKASDKPSNDEKNKIKGDYIEGRGLKAYDSAGNIRVKIDGDTGGLDITDGYIKLQQREYDKYGNEISVVENGNTIYIDPKDGMVFHNGKTGEDVIKLDIQDGSATFSGDIDTKKRVILRCKNLDTNKYSDVGIDFYRDGNIEEQGYINFTIGGSNEPSLNLYSRGGIRLSNKAGSSIHLHGETIDIHGASGINIGEYGETVRINGSDIREDILGLMSDVTELQIKVNALMNPQ